MRISMKCSIALHCLLFLYEYGETEKVTGELLAQSSGCNPVVIRGIISALKKDGMVAVRPGVGGARLVCPPEEITLYRVCMALEPEALDKLMGLHPAPSQICPVGRSIHGVLDHTYEKIRADLRESLGNITLADIVQTYAQGAWKGPLDEGSEETM